MKNWKTTVAGLVGAIVTYLVAAIQSGQPLDWKSIAAALPMLILGYLAKDANQSPPSTPTSSEIQRKIPIISLLLMPFFVLVGCVTDPVTGQRVLSTQGRAAVTAGEQVLMQAALGAAEYYLGGKYPSTNELALSGLYGVAQVVQAYVGQPIPQNIVATSAGNPLIGNAVASKIDSTTPVTQKDADTLYSAAALAAVN